MALARLLSLLLLVAGQGRAEYVRLFRVQEGVPPGTRIGFIGEAEVRRGGGFGVLRWLGCGWFITKLHLFGLSNRRGPGI